MSFTYFRIGINTNLRYHHNNNALVVFLKLKGSEKSEVVFILFFIKIGLNAFESKT